MNVMDISFHYPPELFSLLVDTIPLLCRSKIDVLLFFKGAGVEHRDTCDAQEIVKADRKQITKYEIVRRVLTNINSRGEVTLRERREVLKRVVEFESFDSCWEPDRLKAQGLVAQIQKVVNVKDSFTRIRNEFENERREKIAQMEAELKIIRERREAIEKTKHQLYSLFHEVDPRARGKKLELVLNQLFVQAGVGIRKAFEVIDPYGAGIIEQIDGVIEFDGHLYFVEMKWWKDPVGVPEVSQHMMRVFLRSEARAIIISASDFTATAVAECRQALTQKCITFCTLQEFVCVLEHGSELLEFLRRKVRATLLEQNPFPKVSYD